MATAYYTGQQGVQAVKGCACCAEVVSDLSCGEEIGGQGKRPRGGSLNGTRSVFASRTRSIIGSLPSLSYGNSPVSCFSRDFGRALTNAPGPLFATAAFCLGTHSFTLPKHGRICSNQMWSKPEEGRRRLYRMLLISSAVLLITINTASATAHGFG